MNNTLICNTWLFLFTGDDVFKLIKDLSGGERDAYPCKADARCQFLLLDEPTNYLDITSRRYGRRPVPVYRKLCSMCPMTGILSTDRSPGSTSRSLINYIGNYDYYLEKKRMEAAFAARNHPLPHLQRKVRKRHLCRLLPCDVKWTESQKRRNRPGSANQMSQKTEDSIHALKPGTARLTVFWPRRSLYRWPLMELNRKRRRSHPGWRN